MQGNFLNSIKYVDAKDSFYFIDVRSPSEHEDDTITGAVNIPLLTDEERAEVGKTYIHVGKIEAKKLGVKFISPKLPDMMDKVLDIKFNHSHVAAFCSRGGYRSSFFTAAFSSVGIPIYQIEGGYKSYRKEVMDSLPKLNDNINYIVVSGNTGVGKTDILHSLRSKGYSVLDLEGAANHRGSLLGNIGLGKCNSQKKFETNIYDQLMNVKDDYVFIEAESQKIGSVTIPKFISDKMKQGVQIFVDADMESRINNLRHDYILNENWRNESFKAVGMLEKHLSRDKIEMLKSEIMEGNFDFAAMELMKNYYDPMYCHKSGKLNYSAKFHNENTSAFHDSNVSDEIIKWYDENFKNRMIIKSNGI